MKLEEYILGPYPTLRRLFDFFFLYSVTSFFERPSSRRGLVKDEEDLEPATIDKLDLGHRARRGLDKDDVILATIDRLESGHRARRELFKNDKTRKIED